MRKVFHTVLFMALGSVILSCGSKPSSTPAGPFPPSNEVPGWSRVGEPRTFEASNLWQYIDGDAERYVQAGVVRTLTTDYRYKEKIDTVADVHIMKTPDGARKIFDSELSPEAQAVKLGDAARLARTSLTFRKGPYLVRLVAYQDTPEMGKALVELGRAVERKFGRQ